MVRKFSIIICLYLINLSHAISSSCFLTYFENEKLQNQLPCEEYINKNKEFFKDTPQYLALKKNNEILNPNTIKRFLELRPNDYFVMATKEYEENKSAFRKNVYKNGNPHNIPKSCLRYCRDSLLVTDNQLHSCYKIVKKEGNQGEPKYCQDSLYRSIQKKSDIGATLLASDSLTSGPIEPSLSIECPDVNAADFKNESSKKDETKPSSNSIDKSAKMLIAKLFGGCEALGITVPKDYVFQAGIIEGEVNAKYISESNEEDYFKAHYAMRENPKICRSEEKVKPVVYGFGARVDSISFNENKSIVPTSSAKDDGNMIYDYPTCLKGIRLPACKGKRKTDLLNTGKEGCSAVKNPDFYPLGNGLKCVIEGDGNLDIKALDCNGFVSAAIANAGLRIIPKGQPPKTPPNFLDRGICSFETSTFEKTKEICEKLGGVYECTKPDPKTNSKKLNEKECKKLEGELECGKVRSDKCVGGDKKFTITDNRKDRFEKRWNEGDKTSISAKGFFWNEASLGYINASTDENPTCMDFPTADEPLKAGDVFQWTSDSGNGDDGHIGIISDVGEDPFGFSGKDLSYCENINPDKFNFKIAHSSSDFGNLGPMIVDVKNSKQKNHPGLIAWAKRACEVKFSKPTVTYGKVSYKYKGQKKQFQILRHKGKTADENCHMAEEDRAKIPNEDCMRNKCQEYF